MSIPISLNFVAARRAVRRYERRLEYLVRLYQRRGVVTPLTGYAWWCLSGGALPPAGLSFTNGEARRVERPLATSRHEATDRAARNAAQSVHRASEKVASSTYRTLTKALGPALCSTACRTAPRALIAEATRQLVFSRDHHQCQICGARGGPHRRRSLHADHVIPVSQGGSGARWNVQALCSACNLCKRARLHPPSVRTALDRLDRLVENSDIGVRPTKLAAHDAAR